MSSATTNSSTVPSPPLAVAPRSVPTLEDLYQMTSKPDERVVIRGVDWRFYEQLADSIPDRCHIHVDYDGKDVEIISPGLVHDNDKRLLGRVVELVAEECEISFKSAGQTTWKRPDVARGLEADESYFFHADKLDAVAACKARRSLDIADYPNPDLGIEVDMSPPKIDRPGIYAALKVAEVWRFDGERQELVIERLEDDGTYRAVDRSSFLPVSAAEIRRWVVEEDSHDESAWARRLRAWVRAEVAPRLPG
jgi:Uma2 family endonuclease